MGLRFVFLYFFYCITTVSWAQQDDIISNKTSEDLRAQLEALDESKVEEIISLSNLLYKTAFEKEDPERMVYALEKLSHANLNIGNNGLAIEYLDNAISIGQEHQIPKNLMVDLIKLKGNHYFDIEEYDKAANIYYTALDLAQEIDYTYAIWALYSNLGFIKLRSGEPQKALEELEQSLLKIPTIAEPGSYLSKRSKMLINTRICEAYINLRFLDSALYFNDQGLEMTKLIRVDNAHIDLLMHRGILYMAKQDYVTALIFLEDAKELSYEANDFVFLGKILNLIASCNFEQKDYQNSIRILQESLAILGENYNNSDELSRCFRLLGQSYKMIGNLEKSNEYYEKHILSLSRLNNKKISASRKVRDATFRNYKKAIKNLETVSQKDKNSLLYTKIGVIVFGIALILVLLIFRSVKIRNKKKFDQLLGKIEEHEKRLASNTVSSKSIPVNIIEATDEKLNTEFQELDISEDLRQQILTGLAQMESKEYFLKKECNLYNVAKKIHTNTSYLSKVINSQFGKNFHTYINDLRINYAIVRLKNDSKFRSFSIKSIAEEVGYKSADSFSKYFKAHTGLLPSFYIKKLKSQQKQVN